MADEWNASKSNNRNSNADEIDTLDAPTPIRAADNDPLGETVSATPDDAWRTTSVDSGIAGTAEPSGMAGSARDNAISPTTPANDPFRSTESNRAAYSTDTPASNGNGTASSLKQQTAQKSHELLEKGKETAGQAYDRAKSEVKSKLSDQKERATGSLVSATRALENSSQQFRDQNLVVVADIADSFAGQVRRAGDYLRDKDMDELGRDVEKFAKNNPAVFIGGAFLLGVAVARFLRSSESGSPLDAFSGNEALVPAGQTGLTTQSDEPFGERPLSAHDYTPGYGISSTNRPASA